MTISFRSPSVELNNLHRRQLQMLQHQQQHQHQQQQQQQQRHLFNSSGASSLHQRSSSQQPIINMIPELMTESPHHIPYKVTPIRVLDHTIDCINLNAFAYTEHHLMMLADLNKYFFPNISLESCKRVLMVLNIELFVLNR